MINLCFAIIQEAFYYIFNSKLIQELNMTEPVFEVVSKKRKIPQKSKEQTHSSYSLLRQDYISRSYGYYAEFFIKKISEKAQNEHEKLRKFQLRKILREIIQKYMMTDLEIIYLEYFASLHQWNYSSPLIQQPVYDKRNNNDLNEINCLKLFLHLVSFFVKTYVGLKEEVIALTDFHNQNFQSFAEIYQLWTANSPQNFFKISPRDLNQIYTEYSRSCGQRALKKDYNQMVDKILDLSTTYSIMPTKQKESKSKKSSSKGSKEVIPMMSKKNNLRNVDSQIWQQNNSFKLDFSDLRSNKKDTIFHGGSSFMNGSQQKVQCAVDEKKSDSLIPKKVSLNKKKKIEKDEVNTVAKTFFRGKDLNLSLQDLKKNQNHLRDFIPNSFLDLNAHSSRIQSLPLPYRNNSNIFGPSTLF